MRRNVFCAPIGAPVAVALWLCHVAAAGTTYYVNGACGNDAWSGTSAVCAAPDGPKYTIHAAVSLTVDGDEVVVADGVYVGVDLPGRSIALRSENGPGACRTGRLRAINKLNPEALEITGFQIQGSAASGGAIRVWDTDLTIADCDITYSTADVAGGLWMSGGSLVMRDCRIVGNTANVGAGGILVTTDSSVTIQGCSFIGNTSVSAIGAAGIGASSCEIVDCFFAENEGAFTGGALGLGVEVATIANCIFSRNTAGFGSGVTMGGYDLLIAGCTFSGNGGSPIANGGYATVGAVLTNSIVWGNDPPLLEIPGIVVNASDIEGGWGDGNIDADPLFVSPGTDDVRLSFGSPCANAGNNGAIPPDSLDQDGDGDTSEAMPFDLDANPRVLEGVVDMGAYEGGFKAGNPAASDSDIDQGEVVLLVPEGSEFDPVQAPAVMVLNLSGGNDGAYLVTQLAGAIHSGAGGHNELSDVLVLETSLPGGSYMATTFIAFDEGDLAWTGPLSLDLTSFDAASGHWRLAVAGNVQDSPGHAGPVGDRIAVESTGSDFGVTTDRGDYGVFWNPALAQGFVWANLDTAGEVGVGNQRCEGDCFPARGDGAVGMPDLLALLTAWGGGGAADFDADGAVTGLDLDALLQGWGTCLQPGSVPATDGPFARPRAVGRVSADLRRIQAAWGSCDPACPADIDGDGSVGMRDLLMVLARSDMD